MLSFRLNIADEPFTVLNLLEEIIVKLGGTKMNNNMI